MIKSIYKVSAFTDSINGGNLAGVVLDADKLTDTQMLQIAKDVGYSETAFVMKSDRADFKVRFFTPVDEVDLCGHATIATFNLLRNLGIVKIGNYTQETKAGILNIKIYNDHVYMEQNKPEFYELIDKKDIQKCFTSQSNDYIEDMPIQIVSTGLKDIILPVKNLDVLLDLTPNLELIEEISRQYDASGIHAFCLETINGVAAHARNFAPRYGINEESATGTSNGALACYLTKYLRNTFNDNLVIEQGYIMKKPSKILVELKYDKGEVIEVYVGGSAITTYQ